MELKIQSIKYWIFGLGISCLLYAVIRYHFFKGVSWEHFPLYIFNKAISLTAILMFLCSLLTKFLIRFWSAFKFSNTSMTLAISALAMAFIHGIISLILLRQEYYPALFGENGQFTFKGEIGLLLGVLVFAAMVTMGILSIVNKFNSGILIEKRIFKTLKLASVGLVGGHVFFLGIDSWETPLSWPGYLFPISLIAFLAVIFTAGICLRDDIRKSAAIKNKKDNDCIY